ncbi:MAG: hypothetical protein SFX46_09775 [Aeromonas hydrophila]|uniref:hypothetical protein n=1 Tax=Aeromonas hydrophila TaxID=644 RepID=UPI0029BEFF73|nr:hypothetical protein [Aeromonas hydrophila]MDX2125084.1 hypothetical protein [Aeromonas hydrophila]
MVYKNKAGQPRERTMVAAYQLVTEFGATQANVAATLGCSQATIANWVKEVGYQKAISGLERELSDANDYIQELQQSLPSPTQNVEDDDFIETDFEWDDDDDFV